MLATTGCLHLSSAVSMQQGFTVHPVCRPQEKLSSGCMVQQVSTGAQHLLVCLSRCSNDADCQGVSRDSQVGIWP